MKWLLYSLLVCFVCSCSSHKTTTKYEKVTDSIFVVRERVDSVFEKDSIYMYSNGDTVYRYVEKFRYKYKVLTDTLCITRIDTVKIDKEVVKKEATKWYNKGFQWIGKMCLFTLFIWGVVLLVKNKFS